MSSATSTCTDATMAALVARTTPPVGRERTTGRDCCSARSSGRCNGPPEPHSRDGRAHCRIRGTEPDPGRGRGCLGISAARGRRSVAQHAAGDADRHRTASDRVRRRAHDRAVRRAVGRAILRAIPGAPAVGRTGHQPAPVDDARLEPPAASRHATPDRGSNRHADGHPDCPAYAATHPAAHGPADDGPRSGHGQGPEAASAVPRSRQRTARPQQGDAAAGTTLRPGGRGR
jgi:hypothetical protein